METKRRDRRYLKWYQKTMQSFPRIESRYLRAQNSRGYLDGSLSLSEMFHFKKILVKNMPKNVCTTKSLQENLTFFSPEKISPLRESFK